MVLLLMLFLSADSLVAQDHYWSWVQFVLVPETTFGYSVRCSLSAMVLSLPIELQGNQAVFARWLIRLNPFTWEREYVGISLSPFYCLSL